MTEKPLNRMSMAHKFLLLSMLTFILPLGFFVSFSYRSYSSAVDNRLFIMTQNILSLIEKNVEYTINDVSDTGNIILTDSAVQSALSADPAAEGYRREIADYDSAVEDLLINLTNNKQYIGTILLTNGAYSLVKYKSLTYRSDTGLPDLSGQLWMDDTLRTNGKGNWFPGGSDGYFKNNVLLYTKLIRSLNRLNPIGILLIGIDKKVFQDLLSPVSEMNGTQVVIWQDSEILYNSVPASGDALSSLTSSEALAFLKESGIRRTSDGGRVYARSILCDQTGWHITAITPYEVIRLDKRKTLTLFIVVAFLTFLISLLGSWLFTNSITETTRQLQRYVDNLKTGRRERIVFNKKDEIGRIGEAFLHVVDENEKLTTNLYKSLYREKEAELIALQSQINPHFLYNALDSVFWMAEDAGAPEISRMAVALSGLFRLSLNNGEKLIPIRKELEMMENYVTVQKIRFEDRIDVTIDVEEGLMDVKIVKFILQPLVENAIHHGLSSKEEGGSIRISIERDREDIVITVCDDGAGFDMTQKNILKEGYAIRNINERLKLYYGDDYGVSLNSAPEQGTTARVRLKAEENN